MQSLMQSGELMIEDEKELEVFLSTLAIVSRFWISEARITYRHLSAQQQVNHYVLIVAQLLLPYASPEGAKKLKLLLKNSEHILP
jgi:hypothetical protein